jgi:hypothetical protein
MFVDISLLLFGILCIIMLITERRYDVMTLGSCILIGAVLVLLTF